MMGLFVRHQADKEAGIRHMLTGKGIIKTAMTERGFQHRRSEDQFTIRGQYARNLQMVYSKEYSTRRGALVDLVYFAVDILGEKLVIGLYRENPDIENGIHFNKSHTIDLADLNAATLARELDRFIPPVKDKV